MQRYDLPVSRYSLFEGQNFGDPWGYRPVRGEDLSGPICTITQIVMPIGARYLSPGKITHFPINGNPLSGNSQNGTPSGATVPCYIF